MHRAFMGAVAMDWRGAPCVYGGCSYGLAWCTVRVWGLYLWTGVVHRACMRAVLMDWRGAPCVYEGCTYGLPWCVYSANVERTGRRAFM